MFIKKKKKKKINKLHKSEFSSIIFLYASPSCAVKSLWLTE